MGGRAKRSRSTAPTLRLGAEKVRKMETTNALKGEPMKFVLNGRTFDTATSSTVAINRGIREPSYNNSVGDSELRYEDVLYRTQKGAFFVHEHHTEKFVDRKGKPVVTDYAWECDPENAVKWIVEYGAVIVDAAGLPLPDEA